MTKYQIVQMLWDFERLEYLDWKLQTIVVFENWRVLYSYNSIIAISIDEDETIYLWNDWNCSKTTSKYRNMFLYEDTKATQAKINSWEYQVVAM